MEGRQNSAYRCLPVHDNLHPPFLLPELPTADGPLTELFPEFVQAWIDELDRDAADIIVRNDTASLIRLGHTIKGSFMQFGLTAHASIGQQLMAFAEQGNWNAANDYVNALLQMLRSLRQSLDHSP
jgi:hypothetical protein